MDLFEDKKHLVFYRNVEELKTLVETYLKDPESRQKIAAEGRKEVLKKHTYSDRINRIIELIRF